MIFTSAKPACLLHLSSYCNLGCHRKSQSLDELGLRAEHRKPDAVRWSYTRPENEGEKMTLHFKDQRAFPRVRR